MQGARDLTRGLCATFAASAPLAVKRSFAPFQMVQDGDSRGRKILTRRPNSPFHGPTQDPAALSLNSHLILFILSEQHWSPGLTGAIKDAETAGHQTRDR